MKMKLLLATSWVGTLVNLASDAKTILGAIAALFSVIASGYAIALARRNLRKAERDDFRSRLGAIAILCALCFFQGCTLAPDTSGRTTAQRIAAWPSYADAALTTLQTNIVEEVIGTNVVLTTNIVAVPKAALARSIQTGQAISGFLPPPIGEVSAGVLGLISLLTANAVRRRNAVLRSVILGVEKGGTKEVKEEIARQAGLHNTLRDLHVLVEKHT